MRNWLLGSTSVALLAVVPQAGWSLSPQEAWDHWKTQGDRFGLTVSAETETPAGATLTLEGLKYVGEWGFVQAEYNGGTFTLSEEGDSVSVSYPADGTITIKAAPPGESAFEATLNLSYPGATTLLSQEGDKLIDVSRFPGFTIAIGEVRIDDKPFDITGEYAMSNLEYSQNIATSGDPVYESDVSISDLAINYQMQIPEAKVTMKSAAQASNVTAVTTAALGALLTELEKDMSAYDDAAMMDMIGRVLDSGFRIDSKSHYESYTVSDETTDENGTFSNTFTIREGDADVTVDAGGMAYDVTSGSLDGALVIPGLPLPELAFAASAMEIAFDFPFTSGEEGAPYSWKLALDSLTMGEPIWSLFDPGAVLPRDPASLVVSQSGQLRWISNLFSAETVGARTPPVEPLSANLDELKLAMLGAELTGTGAFTFDQVTKKLFSNGVPQPEGKAEFRLTGGNALLDKLVQAGLLPQDQFMMTRMMIGMFAVPGEGDDVLTSEIEVDADGKVLINGAPVPF
ncbi:MAG: DUF2125 domain-containing protein [Tropicimonas sp.]